MDRYDISVIIPVYNAGKYLVECIEYNQLSMNFAIEKDIVNNNIVLLPYKFAE